MAQELPFPQYPTDKNQPRPSWPSWSSPAELECATLACWGCPAASPKQSSHKRSYLTLSKHGSIKDAFAQLQLHNVLCDLLSPFWLKKYDRLFISVLCFFSSAWIFKYTYPECNGDNHINKILPWFLVNKDWTTHSFSQWQCLKHLNCSIWKQNSGFQLETVLDANEKPELCAFL